MKAEKAGDFIGYSEQSIKEAIYNALQKAGEPASYKVIETRGFQGDAGKRCYQVMLSTSK